MHLYFHSENKVLFHCFLSLRAHKHQWSAFPDSYNDKTPLMWLMNILLSHMADTYTYTVSSSLICVCFWHNPGCTSVTIYYRSILVPHYSYQRSTNKKSAIILNVRIECATNILTNFQNKCISFKMKYVVDIRNYFFTEWSEELWGN